MTIIDYIHVNGAQCQKRRFGLEGDLDKMIGRSAEQLFGPHRVYLPVKIRVGAKLKGSGIPDGLLFDFSALGDPKLYLVEVELASHDIFKEVGAQLLRFSVALESDKENFLKKVEKYFAENHECREKMLGLLLRSGYSDLHNFLADLIKNYRLQMLVVIDECSEALVSAVTKFEFPVLLMEIQAYSSDYSTFRVSSPFSDSSADTDGRELDTIIMRLGKSRMKRFLSSRAGVKAKISKDYKSRIKYITVYDKSDAKAVTHWGRADFRRLKRGKNTWSVWGRDFHKVAHKPLGGKFGQGINRKYGNFGKILTSSTLMDAFK